MGEELVDWDKLTFSMTETDFMYVTKTGIDDPWMPGEMRPYGNISISPAAGVLNYGQGLFEGMKAYRTSSGRVVLFRPEENARRMQRGADRLKMPPFQNLFSLTLSSNVSSRIQDGFLQWAKVLFT